MSGLPPHFDLDEILLLIPHWKFLFNFFLLKWLHQKHCLGLQGVLMLFQTYTCTVSQYNFCSKMVPCLYPIFRETGW